MSFSTTTKFCHNVPIDEKMPPSGDPQKMGLSKELEKT
jgi:hypothetical protein